MKFKGVTYDVGRVYYFNWRPTFDPKIVHRELEIIKNDLHCNAVRICGFDIKRLIVAAEYALDQGLVVWLSPELWNRSQKKTIEYLSEAAKSAQILNQAYPNKLIFSVSSEATLFTKGIIEGGNVVERMKNPNNWAKIKSGAHNKPLNDFLAKANDSVRGFFDGKVSYASLIWETVDWDLFDFVGVDHYLVEKIKDKYVDMLKPLFATGKPVVATEFGFRTYQGAAKSPEGMGGDIVDHRSEFLHHLPLIGRVIRPRIIGVHIRDEDAQAHELVEQLKLLDGAGVDGGFIMTFISPLSTYDDNPKYDLDMASYSLVKTYNGKHGSSYPEMKWDPKKSFKAVADYYGNR